MAQTEFKNSCWLHRNWSILQRYLYGRYLDKATNVSAGILLVSDTHLPLLVAPIWQWTNIPMLWNESSKSWQRLSPVFLQCHPMGLSSKLVSAQFQYCLFEWCWKFDSTTDQSSDPNLEFDWRSWVDDSSFITVLVMASSHTLTTPAVIMAWTGQVLFGQYPEFQNFSKNLTSIHHHLHLHASVSTISCQIVITNCEQLMAVVCGWDPIHQGTASDIDGHQRRNCQWSTTLN